jgi:cbb3-type cytochrome oxidase subunit 3
MDVNDLRVAITVTGLALFLALVVHTWSRKRSAEHEAAAQLPFIEEEVPQPALNRGEKP